MNEQAIKELPPLTVEKVREMSAIRLKRHIRGLEDARLLSREDASKLLGDVIKLEAMAKGEFVLKEKQQ